MKKIIIFLCLCTFSVSLMAADWTIMYYGAGEKKIQDGQIRTLKKFRQYFKDNGKVNVLAQFDYEDEPAKLYKLTEKSWLTLGDSKNGDISDNMGKAETLYKFLKVAFTQYPAKHYVLIIDGHGSGWESYRGEGSTKNAPLSFESFWKVFYEMDKQLDATAYDYDDNDCLTLIECKGAIMKAVMRHNSGKKLDILFNGACFQMMSEWIFQLTDSVKYIIACPTTCYVSAESMAGFIYNICRKEASCIEVVKKITEDYIDDISKKTVICGLDTDGFNRLIPEFNKWIFLLIEAYMDNRENVSFKNITDFDGVDHDDDSRFSSFKNVVESVASSTVGNANVKYLNSCSKTLLKLYDEMIIQTWKRGYDGAGGLSLYFPGKKSKSWTKQKNFYLEIDMGRASLWDEFLWIIRGDYKGTALVHLANGVVKLIKYQTFWTEQYKNEKNSDAAKIIAQQLETVKKSQTELLKLFQHHIAFKSRKSEFNGLEEYSKLKKTDRHEIIDKAIIEAVQAQMNVIDENAKKKLDEILKKIMK
ncbi:hypothetical protein KAJ27_02695 [bacterium]|nr:hypothetical protein [bacterium]